MENGLSVVEVIAGTMRIRGCYSLAVSMVHAPAVSRLSWVSNRVNFRGNHHNSQYCVAMVPASNVNVDSIERSKTCVLP